MVKILYAISIYIIIVIYMIENTRVYKVGIRKYSMVDNIKVDDEIIKYLVAEKLVKRESYKSVIKRMIASLKLLRKRR